MKFYILKLSVMFLSCAFVHISNCFFTIFSILAPIFSFYLSSKESNSINDSLNFAGVLPSYRLITVLK